MTTKVLQEKLKDASHNGFRWGNTIKFVLANDLRVQLDMIAEHKELRKIPRQLLKDIERAYITNGCDVNDADNLYEMIRTYCDLRIIYSQAAFDYLSADWEAKKLLADLAGGSVNDTTNTLTAKLIFGNDRNPQSQFCHRDISKLRWNEEETDATS